MEPYEIVSLDTVQLKTGFSFQQLSMQQQSALRYRSHSTCGVIPASVLAWVLVGAIVLQSSLMACMPRVCVQMANAAEDENDSREAPAEEQLEEQLTVGSQRDPRDQVAIQQTARTGILSQRRATLGARFTHRPIEMARRNGVGSLLRC